MSISMIVNILIFTVILLIFIWQNRLDAKRHEERIFWERKRVEATEKLSKEMKEYARHTIELESTKIWMRGMIDQMHTHGKKIDEFMDATKAADPIFVDDTALGNVVFDDKGNKHFINIKKEDEGDE